MEKIKAKFEEMFKDWEIKIPDENYKTKEAGYVQKDGWLIQYCFGKEDDKEYMDVFSEHRMTSPDHFRLYENGDKKDLPIYQTVYAVDKDPEKTEKNKKEYYEYNEKVAQQLIDKGFNRFTINSSIMAGFAGRDDK
jgi:hypothetical protein